MNKDDEFTELTELTENPTQDETMDIIDEILYQCAETKQDQKLELQLGGERMGDSIVITVTYKGNKNANQSLN